MSRPYHMLAIGPSVRATAGSSSDRLDIPLVSSGNRAKRVRIAVVTPSEVLHILPVQTGGVVTTTTGMPLTKEHGAIILDVIGYSFLAHIRGGTADVVFNVTPIETE